MKNNTNALRLTAGMLIAFAIAYFLYATMNTENDPVFGIDFVPYHLAGRLLAEGNPAPLTNYETTGGYMADQGPFFDYFHQYFFPESPLVNRWVYLPAYAWLFRPLASLKFPSASRVWLVFNAILCLTSVLLLWDARQRTRIPDIPISWHFAWYLFIGLTFQPVFSNLMHGQVTGLMVFAFCLGYWFLKQNHSFSAGLALGLIAPLKYYPILIIIYFLCRKKWRVVAGAAVSVASLILISLATSGYSGVMAHIRLMGAELHRGGMAAFNNESLNGFLLHALTNGNVNTWQDMAVPLWISLMRLAFILTLLVFIIWVMRHSTDKQIDNTRDDLELAMVITLMLIIAPITWYHYYMWMLFPLFVVFDRLLCVRPLERNYIIWLSLAYGLTVVEGICAIRPLDSQALQHIRIFRIMLSQSFFGVVLLAALIIRLRHRLSARLEDNPRTPLLEP